MFDKTKTVAIIVCILIVAILALLIKMFVPDTTLEIVCYTALIMAYLCVRIALES